jgi:hypothetical protein
VRRALVRARRGRQGQPLLRVNCLDGVDPQALIDTPVKYFDMLHDDFGSPPAETRHL